MDMDLDGGLGVEDDLIAKHVIQINLMFKPKSMNKLGSFNVWRKSGWFGKADELMGFCPANGCLGVVPEKLPITNEEYEILHKNPNDPSKWPKKVYQTMAHYYQSAVTCPVCHTMAIRETLPDSYGFNMSARQISERAEQLFNQLGRDADFLLIRSKENAAFQKAKDYLFSVNRRKDVYAKKLETARDQDMVFYPLKKIIADTASGGSIARRVQSLIEA